jgi:membrane protein
MARLKELPIVLRRVGWLPFSKKVWQEVNDDGVFMMASALAYAWLFAIFPFVLFLVSLLPYLPAHLTDRAEKTLHSELEKVVPHKADVLVNTIDDFMKQPQSGILSIGLLVTVWAASGGMAMTMGALDTTYDVEQRRPYYIQRPFAVLLTIIVATMILIVLVLLPLGTVARNFALLYGDRWLADLGWSPHLLAPILLVWDIVRSLISVFLLFVVLAILYRYGPATKATFSLVSPGAIFSVVVWIVLGELFRIYIDKFGKYEKTYGAVGGVAILLLFFYIDAVVLLIGAEINSEIEAEMRKSSQSLFVDAPKAENAQ